MIRVSCKERTCSRLGRVTAVRHVIILWLASSCGAEFRHGVVYRHHIRSFLKEPCYLQAACQTKHACRFRCDGRNLVTCHVDATCHINIMPGNFILKFEKTALNKLFCAKLQLTACLPHLWSLCSQPKHLQ